MLDLTYRNHFKFGYNGEYYNLRLSPDDKFNVRYGPCLREPYPFREECIATAKIIGESTDLKIYVLLSGGIDSEVVVRSFMANDIPITCVTGIYDNGINEHDIKRTFDFCKKYDLNHETFSINVEDFWRKNLLEYADRTYCITPQASVVMWLADQVDGYVVLGNGDGCYGHGKLAEKEKIVGWYRHYMATNKHGSPGFFQYTPELMLSFINEVQPLLDTREYYQRYDENGAYHGLEQDLKQEIYHKHWPELIKRDSQHGFEKIMVVDAKYRQILKDRYPGADSVCEIPMEKLIGDLTHE